MTDDLQQARDGRTLVAAFTDWHERWWKNDPNVIAHSNAQAAFYAGWEAADAHLPSAARIAETLDAHTLGRPNGGSASVAWCDCSCGHREEMVGGIRDTVEARAKLHRARAVRALFGEVAADE